MAHPMSARAMDGARYREICSADARRKAGEGLERFE